ncbi:MAG: tRNA (guanosine(46)-N7)-methyltransferase TrmB [Rhodospirillales bacterium RIFCSPLOWO2_12_FULL_58_28]|nr:MAG: tRNA (guanosine(46)-N7)-methyltransferase TrmB [Rhodospirillales bacterium RIFCSPLOWO2_02_FULL_58_16]OHC77866.1 MAG: tRNA (guanosine(46)-N7)-methyltransferase TrmB [Rhodospirillales bacterium RIFCSPLOWO2_12_FULL_58_28]
MTGDGGNCAERLRSYGRRRGRALRKSRQELLNDLLPRLRPDSPGGGLRLDLQAMFPDPVEDIWLEVGFGSGEHLAKQALTHPGIGMIGCEPFINGVTALLARIQSDDITNIRIFDDDARLLFDALPDAVIGRAFVLFADPWPKKRHNRRRFISTECLDELAHLLKDGAELRFASDHMEYIRWTLEHIIRHPCFSWTAKGPDDWRRRPDDWFETRYENKALERGDACVYLQFIRLPR